jgi:hypothetical protein
MVNALEQVDVVLVDNRASGGTKILQYIEESRIIELQAQLLFDLVFVVVVLDDKDAIIEFDGSILVASVAGLLFLTRARPISGSAGGSGGDFARRVAPGDGRRRSGAPGVGFRGRGRQG